MLKLVKTTGGDNGAPQECGRCGCKDFKVHILGWACIGCLNYHPSQLGFDIIKGKTLAFQRYSDIVKKEK